MLSTSKLGVLILKCSNFHTSSLSSAKPAKFMRKVMGLSSKKKRIFVESGILPAPDMFSKGSNEGRYSGNSKRAAVLNKLFMRYITDLMATGEYSSEFLGHGIEINRVQIAPDYKGLNVFWVAKGTPDDEMVEKILKKNAGYLRHELSTLRVMGVVPSINFVKDKKYSEIIEVDNRLAKADFGEDYEPIEMASKLKTQLELYTPLPSDVRVKIQEMDKQFPENESDTDDALPVMPQDVLGLNHAEILNRVRKNMKKSEAAHRFQNESGESHDKVQNVNENPIQFLSNKEQRESFRNFLAKRELLRSKARKLEKNYYPDIEYMKEEFMERRNEYFKNMDIYEEENDYISDEEEGEECKEMK